MPEITDTELAFKVQESNDPVALDELISRHSGIYVDMLRKFGSNSLTDTQISDLMGEKDSNIYAFSLEYNPEKSKFSTFVATRTRYLCLSEKTKNKKNSKITNFDTESFHLEYEGDSPLEGTSKMELLEKVMDLIDSHHDERVVKIFKERYFSRDNGKLKPWHEVGDAVGLSYQGCINLHNQSLPKILKSLENAQTTF